MKKAILILLTLAMLLTLSACGKQSFGEYVTSELQEVEDLVSSAFGSDDEEEVLTKEASEAAFEPFSGEGFDGSELDIDDLLGEDEEEFLEDFDNEADVEYAAPATDAPTSEGFEVITVVDCETCAIKVTGVHPDSIWGCTVDVYLENKTKRDDYSFNIQSAYINGLLSNAFFYEDLEGGEARSATVYLSDDTILESGITDITEIELTFSAYDYGDWSVEDITPPPVFIYPQGEENAERYIREPQESDIVLLENEDISVRLVGFEPDPGWSYDAILYLENRADCDLEVTLDSISLNGIESPDSFFYETVGTGKSAFSRLQFYADFFENNGITAIEELEFMLQIFETENYDLLAEEWITVNPA